MQLLSFDKQNGQASALLCCIESKAKWSFLLIPVLYEPMKSSSRNVICQFYLEQVGRVLCDHLTYMMDIFPETNNDSKLTMMLHKQVSYSTLPLVEV